MCRFFVNSALKSRHSRRVELRASCKVITSYFSCALTELISRQIMRGTRAVSRRRVISRLQPRSSRTVRWLCGIACEIAFGQISNGDGPWCSLAFANVPQRLLPKNSPKRLK
jgi:hypothetical protein